MSGADDEEKRRRRPRSRSRSRTRLTSRVNFFETVWSSPPADIMVIQPASSPPQRPEDVEMTQDQADELERQMRQRRRQAAAVTVGHAAHAVNLRRVVSPVRVDPIESSSPGGTGQVFVSSWTDSRGSRSPDRQQQQQQPPWRLARRSTEPDARSPTAVATAETGQQNESGFSPDTSPTLALNKYQEWRASRFSSSSEQPTDQPVAPWRSNKNRSGSSSSITVPPSPTSPLTNSESSSSPSVQSSQYRPLSAGRSGGVRSVSVPQHHPHTGTWYNEFRSASMSQTAARFDLFRGADFAASMNSHYDFHIAEIKGSLFHFLFYLPNRFGVGATSKRNHQLFCGCCGFLNK